MKDEELYEQKEQEKKNRLRGKSGHRRQNANLDLNKVVPGKDISYPGKILPDDDKSFYEEDLEGGEHDKENEISKEELDDFLKFIQDSYKFIAEYDEKEVKMGNQKSKSQAGFFAKRQEINIAKRRGEEIEEPQDLIEFEKGKGRRRVTNTAFEKEIEENNRRERDLKQKMDSGYQEYKIKTANRIELRKNADSITKLYKLLDSKDHWYRGSSPAFRALKEDLKTLKKLANQMVEESRGKGKENWEKRKHTYTAYLECANRVKESAKRYLTYKKDKINSDYAQARFDTITELQNVIDVNERSVRDAFAQDTVKRFENVKGERARSQYVEGQKAKMRAWRDQIKKIDLFSETMDSRKTYLGDRYTEAMLADINTRSPYSLDRNAAFSVTNMALLLEKDEKTGQPKYTLDDILDPTKLKEQKQAKFHEVVVKMTRETLDQKWIAQTIHDGTQKAYEMMGQLTEKVDFSNPDFIYDMNLCKAAKLSQVMFDAWQENVKCKEEITEIACQRDKSIQNFEQYRHKAGAQRGVLDKFMIQVNDYTKAIVGEEGNFHVPNNGILMVKAYGMNEAKKLYAKKAAENKGKHISEWLSETEMKDVRQIEMAGADKFAELPMDDSLRDHYMPEILNGSIFDGIKWKKVPDRIAGYLYELEGDVQIKLMEDHQKYIKMGADEVYQRINQQLDHFMEMKKTSEADMQPYLDGAIKGMTTLAKLSVKARNLTEEEKQEAKEAMKEVFSYNLAESFKEVKASGNDLKNLVDQNLDQLEIYNRYVNNIDKGSVASLVIADPFNEVENAKETVLAKGRFAKNMLETGGYKTDYSVTIGFAFAHTASVMDAAGKLPFNPNTRRSFTPMDHVGHVFENRNQYLTKNMIKQYKNPDGQKPDILDNRDKLKDYSKTYNRNKPAPQMGKN